MRKPAYFFVFALCIAVICLDSDAAPNRAEKVRASLVRITVNSQAANYRAPWNPGMASGGVGSGFIIAGNLIMTNAHVVSNARLLSVDKHGDAKRYEAKVAYIAHDCDLALLQVGDEAFFEGMTPLEFGDIPELHSNVFAYGYPIGGQRMSVTRGVVSRIEFRAYSHSGVDSHLSIQVDAAINPGNSGGPVMQDGKVVGVAFQSYRGSVAQNTGYMIPTPVIKRFLKDIEDGRYDGYVELAIYHFNLRNHSYRKYLKLPNDQAGVVIAHVLDGAGSSAGALKAGDVLTAIDGHTINNDGHITLDGEYLALEEIVERKFHRDTVMMDVIRDGKKQAIKLTLKGAWPYRLYARSYDSRPRFVLFSGLLFQPLNRNLINAYQIDNLDLMKAFSDFVNEETFKERPEMIVLTAMLPDPINAYVRGQTMSQLDEINGLKIRRLEDVIKAFERPVKMHVIKLIGKGRPIVIDAEEAKAAGERIRKQYEINLERHLGDD